MNERVCVFPGSFDPPTVGHLDLIRRAAALYDRVIVAVAHNPDKRGAIPAEAREEMLRTCVRDLPNVEADRFDGLTVRYAAEKGACAMIRGLRSEADFDAEWTLAQLNRTICPRVETVLLMGLPEHAHVSSSAVRQMAAFGADWHSLVPAEIVDQVAEHLNNTHLKMEG